MALEHTEAQAGAQIPQPDATVRRGGEQLQKAHVWVEVNQAAHIEDNTGILNVFGLVFITRTKLNLGLKDLLGRRIINFLNLLDKQINTNTLCIINDLGTET